MDDDGAAVAHRVVVVVDGWHALRVAAHVEDRLTGALRNGHVLDELAQAQRLLVHLDGAVGSVVAVAGGVGAALRDAREQQARQGCPLERDPGGDGEAGDSAHDSRVLARALADRHFPAGTS